MTLTSSAPDNVATMPTSPVPAKNTLSFDWTKPKTDRLTSTKLKHFLALNAPILSISVTDEICQVNARVPKVMTKELPLGFAIRICCSQLDVAKLRALVNNHGARISMMIAEIIWKD